MKPDHDIEQDLRTLQESGSPAPLSQEEQTQLRQEFSAFLDLYPETAEQQRGRAVHVFAWMRQYAASLAIIVVVGSSALHHMTTGGIVRIPDLQQVRIGTPVHSARADTASLTRRLQEAERLIAAGQFEPRTFDQLRTDIDTHMSAAHTYLLHAQTAGAADDALDASAELEMLLDAHYAIVYVLADTYGRLDDAQITGLIDELNHRRMQIADIRTALEDARTNDAHNARVVDTYATGLFRDINHAHDQLEALIETRRSSAPPADDGALLWQADILIERSAERLAPALEHMHDGNVHDAIKLLQAASNDTRKALIFIDAHTALYPEGGDERTTDVE